MAFQPVVVIGAGPAGLTTAYELAKNGQPSTLLEAGKQVGGISQTVSYKNFLFDIRLRILLKIAAGRVMRTNTEIAKCQTRDVDTKTCSIAVKGSSNNWES